MHILLVNDDGIHAPGINALHAELIKFAKVTVVAPAVEQSGVGHSITYLHPLLAHREYRNDEFFGWKVEGSPADCVKLGIMELAQPKPDLVVSGINHGANVGINILYSGTVAAAIEGAFFGVTSIALSQWLGNTPPHFPRAARMGAELIRQLIAQNPPQGSLWNINFPTWPNAPENSDPENSDAEVTIEKTARTNGPKGVKLTSMGVRRQRETLEKRIDPRGRTYYWTGLEPIHGHQLVEGSDVAALVDGYVTITPLHFDLTNTPLLAASSAQWPTFQLPAETNRE